MGMDPEGKLAYGYHLGGDETGWKVEQTTGEYGGLSLDWLSEDEDGYGFVDLAERRLRASTGFVEIPYREPRPDDYYALSNAADAAVGVRIIRCGSPDFPAYVLCTKVYSVEWGDTKLLDLDALAREAAEGGWDEKLRRALEVLGITPKQTAPGWLLCAFYG